MFDDVTDILLALIDISSILGVTVAKDDGTDVFAVDLENDENVVSFFLYILKKRSVLFWEGSMSSSVYNNLRSLRSIWKAPEHKCLVGLCNINKHNFDFCQVLALD